jgi:predicted amino acid racemase
MRELVEKELDQVSGGAITQTTTTTNPQGHVTQGSPGQAQTTTTVATNPAGHKPPGQQP